MGAPLQWPGFKKSPSEKGQDATGPGATTRGPPGGPEPNISHHARAKASMKKGQDATGPGPHPKGGPAGQSPGFIEKPKA